jgi:hypothetical protein
MKWGYLSIRYGIHAKVCEGRRGFCAENTKGRRNPSRKGREIRAKIGRDVWDKKVKPQEARRGDSEDVFRGRQMKHKRQVPSRTMVSDGSDIFVLIDGVKIARRGYPGTPQARTWVTPEPGWQVFDVPPDQLEVTYNGEHVRVFH